MINPCSIISHNRFILGYLCVFFQVFSDSVLVSLVCGCLLSCVPFFIKVVLMPVLSQAVRMGSVLLLVSLLQGLFFAWAYVCVHSGALIEWQAGVACRFCFSLMAQY